jgi:hypothetical protein
MGRSCRLLPHVRQANDFARVYRGETCHSRLPTDCAASSGQPRNGALLLGIPVRPITACQFQSGMSPTLCDARAVTRPTRQCSSCTTSLRQNNVHMHALHLLGITDHPHHALVPAWQCIQSRTVWLPRASLRCLSTACIARNKCTWCEYRLFTFDHAISCCSSPHSCLQVNEIGPLNSRRVL